MTIPQLHPPGEEAEVDFGGVSVWLDGVLTELSMFVLRLSHSGRAVHVCFPGEGQEAFLEGHTVALERLGGVPRRVRYDNLKAAVTRVLAGRDRIESDRFTALRSHFGFDAFFCEPGIAGAHEKGGVEGEVGRFRRRHLVPVPRVESLAELNALLEAADRADDARHIAGRLATVGRMAEAERPSLRPLPAEPFDPTVALQAKADRKARIAVRGSRYSVPAACAGRTVDVRLGGGTVTATVAGRVVARHERSAHKGSEVLVLDHYLEVLARKPGALPRLERARAGALRRWLHRRATNASGCVPGAVSVTVPGRVRSSRCCSCIATSPPPRCTLRSMRWSESARWTRRWWPSRRAASPTAAARPPSWSGRRSDASNARRRAWPATTRCSPRARDEHARDRAGGGGFRSRRPAARCTSPPCAQQASALAEAALRDRLTHLAYLAEVLSAELDDRDARRRERRIHEARFPPAQAPRRLRTWRRRPRSTPPCSPRLERCEWIASGQPVVLLGDSGTGKSHLLIGLGIAACQRGLRVRYTTAAALVNELAEAADERTLSRLVARYGRLDLLCLDEFGYVHLDPRGAELLFQVLTEREERASVAVASNAPFSEWGSDLRRPPPRRRGRRPAHVPMPTSSRPAATPTACGSPRPRGGGA